MITMRARHVVGGVFLAVALARGPAACTTPPTLPPTPAAPPAPAVAAQSSGCPTGWVCTPGTNRCDPSYRCGTCPDDDGDDTWSYLDDGSAMAREAQTDPKLDWIFVTSRPCG